MNTDSPSFDRSEGKTICMNKVEPAKSSESRFTGFNFLSGIGIFTFILVLIVNFIAYIPAVIITTPELLNEHEHTISTNLPLIIDNSPPEISILGNNTSSILAGQICEIRIKINDSNFRDCYLQNTENKNRTSRFFYLSSQDGQGIYSTTFQAPDKDGYQKFLIIARDFAGNTKFREFNLTVKKNPNPYLKLTSPIRFSHINTSTTLSFAPWQNKISRVRYKIDSNDTWSTLLPGEYIETNYWPKAKNILTVEIQAKTGNIIYQNFSITIDDTPPKIEVDNVKSLTQDRYNTFQGRLNNTTVFYKGESVKITVNISEQNLASAYVSLLEKDYELERVNNPEKKYSNFQTILSMPSEAGKYKMRIVVKDLAGNFQTHSNEIQVANIYFNYIPLPIFNITLPENSDLNFPIVNSSTAISINPELGEISKIEISSYNRSIEKDINETDSNPRKVNISLSGITEGTCKLIIKARVRYIFWDYLFVTYPYPPYLAVIPYPLTGWGLVVFFLCVGVSIFLSNIILFQKRLLEEFKWAINTIFKPQKVDLSSKNSIVIIGQLFFATIAFSYMYNLFLSLFQVETHTPDFSSLSLWALIYNLTTAAVFEEIISRTLLIGLPLIVAHAIMSKLKKQKWRYLLGGEFEINKLTVFLIIFSSVTFGLAHAPGWDYWKVLPSIISGLALGYLFVRKGIYASIILHFTINFLSIPLELINEPTCGMVIFVFLLYFWIILGILYIVYFIIRIVKR